MRRALLVFVCILLFLVPVHGVGDQITSLNMEVTVDEYGRSQVKATAVVNFATAPTSFAFPLHSRAGSITASGSGEYKTENRNGVVYAVFTNSAGFTGSQTFTCTYALPCGATSVPDEETPTQEFVMNVIDGGWDYSIGDFSLKMTFAAPVEVQPSWNSAFHGDIIDNSLTISVKGKTLTVKSVQSIIDHETLEMTLTFPDQTFTIVHEAGKTLTVNQILFLVLVLAALIYWFLFLRGHWLSPQRQNYPCSDATAGEIPCQLYGEPADIGGILAHWGNLGYLVIHRRRNGRIMLEKQMDMGNERPRVERRLFEGLFLSGTTCDARSLRFRRVCQKYLPAFRKTWIRRMYRPKAGNPYLLKAIVLGAGLVASLSVFDLLLPSNGFRWFLPDHFRHGALRRRPVGRRGHLPPGAVAENRLRHSCGGAADSPGCLCRADLAYGRLSGSANSLRPCDPLRRQTNPVRRGLRPQAPGPAEIPAKAGKGFPEQPGSLLEGFLPQNLWPAEAGE